MVHLQLLTQFEGAARNRGERMQLNKKPWPLLTVCSLKNRIDPTPDYQRPAVWSRPQKQLLIDTILRGYDIPKFYWRKVGQRPDLYEVVDGQQRLRTIWEFQQDGFPLARDADPIDGSPIARIFYTDLPDDLRIRFDTYSLDIVVIDEADEEGARAVSEAAEWHHAEGAREA